MADLMSGLAILVMLDISPEVAEALPIRESGEIGRLLHRDAVVGRQRMHNRIDQAGGRAWQYDCVAVVRAR